MRLRSIVAIGLTAAILLTGCSAGGATVTAPQRTQLPKAAVRSGDLAFVRGDHIWRVGPDGGDANQITTGPALDRQPAWSPDRSAVAFVRLRDEFGVEGPTWLCVVPASGGKLSMMRKFDSVLQAVCFSPDGSNIAFADFPSNSDGGPLRVGVLDRRSGETTYVAQVDRHLMVGASLSWSPDGSSLLVGVLGQDLEGARVGLVTIANGTISWLNAPDANEAHWSSDGHSMALNRHTQSASSVLIADGDGVARRVLANGAGEDGTPTPVWGASYAPDDRRVAFTDSDGAIWVVGVDGGGKRKVIDNASVPAWSSR